MVVSGRVCLYRSWMSATSVPARRRRRPPVALEELIEAIHEPGHGYRVGLADAQSCYLPHFTHLVRRLMGSLKQGAVTASRDT